MSLYDNGDAVHRSTLAVDESNAPDTDTGVEPSDEHNALLSVEVANNEDDNKPMAYTTTKDVTI